MIGIWQTDLILRTQKTATLFDKDLKTGRHQLTFNAAKFSSGIYFYRMKAKGFSQVKKMMLLKHLKHGLEITITVFHPVISVQMLFILVKIHTIRQH